MPSKKSAKYSLSSSVSFLNQNFALIVVSALLLTIGFFMGTLWSENQTLKSKAGSTEINAVTPNPSKPSVPNKPTKATASVDDDPIIGDKNAPVTLIEFSDYECPFCKRYFDQTLPKIKKEYVETGKVKIVYRDLPLSFHDPMATKEAIAANCSRQQGGDSKYFEFHDQIFKRTVSNGNGLNDEKLQSIATDIGLNMPQFNSCLTDKKMEDEVKNDLADAAKAGATGTPTFVIGKSTKSGLISGTLLVGAQPFSTFKAIIDPLL